MYHIVFNSPRHKPQPVYARAKTRLNSTHNQFELDTIRGSIKSRWELHPYGELAMQKNIWNIVNRAFPENYQWNATPRAPLMNGHIITVDAVADVMWFRLNHEHVTKNGCKMIEIYRDLDESHILKLSNAADEIYRHFTANAEGQRSLTGVSDHLARLDRNTLLPMISPEELTENARIITEIASGMVKQFHDQAELFSNKLKSICADMKQYIEEHKTEIN
jgi:hypothetical protein